MFEPWTASPSGFRSMEAWPGLDEGQAASVSAPRQGEREQQPLQAVAG